ncbi:uncharacterized protein L201_000320 [Kwoniella dendrophila CBS 6074]|uniref:Protein CPL1-like domain-containing protein n=1 Tax=Kwoniella dendrophila CBS 6074 TaxID=1295534 RepID=A0AAX4JJ32_9TREE
MKTTIANALYLLLSASFALGAQPFLGCAQFYPEGDNLIAYDGIIDNCVEACYANGDDYAYIDRTRDDGNNCICGPIAIFPEYYQSQGAIGNTCTAGGYEGYATSSYFDFLNCAEAGGVVYFDATPTIQTESMVDCFSNCEQYTYAVATPNSGEGGGGQSNFNCFCGNDPGEFVYQPQVCDQNTAYVYNYVGGNGPNPSEGIARRNRIEKLRRKLNKKRNVNCPKGLTACSIPGINDSYECIDTQFELESCGGCVNGKFGEDNNNHNVSTGIDCTSLPGVALGASTCYQGKCDVYACKRGWVWVDNVCRKLIE